MAVDRRNKIDTVICGSGRHIYQLKVILREFITFGVVLLAQLS